MKDAKQLIRELVEEVLEEMTTAASGGGQYQTKYAFGVGDRTQNIAKRSMQGGTVKGKKESDDTSVEEGKEDEALPIIRRGVMEEGRNRYYNFRESDMMRNEAKINLAVQEANKMLREVEYLLDISERLKTECGFSNDRLYKRTGYNVIKMNERLKEIAKRINRMRKQ